MSPPLRGNRDFVRLWTGGAVSGLGAAITALVYPLLALGVTGSAGQAGLVGLVTLVARALTQLPAGVLVDRLPLRRVLVGTDLVRVLSTAVLLVCVLTGQLSLGPLLVVALVNGGAAAFGETAHSVALRHVVDPAQLPAAFALDDGRGHAVSLAGQPAGGALYGFATSLPLVADLVCFVVSAVVSATLRTPMLPSTDPADRPRLRADVITGVTFLWREPLLRATLLAASGYQLVYSGAAFVLIASFTAAGATSASIGLLFAVAAVGGILGAVIVSTRPTRRRLGAVVVTMGSTATAVFAGLAWVDRPLFAGILLGAIFVTSAPANALLMAAQVARTPAHLQGRVMAASFLVAGLVAPLGPPLGGLLLDAVGPRATFLTIAAVTAAITLAVHLNRSLKVPATPKIAGG